MKHFIYTVLLLLGQQLFAQDSLYKALHLQYDKVGCFDEDGLAIVSKRAYVGLIDSTGKIRIPFSYDKIKPLTDAYYQVTKDNYVGLLDANNQVIIPVEYQDIIIFRDTLFCVKKENKYGLLNTKNQWVLPCVYETIRIYKNNYLIVKKEELMGMLSPQMQWIVQPKYDDITHLSYNENTYDLVLNDSLLYPFIIKEDKKGVINLQGKILISCEYEFIDGKLHKEAWIVKNEKGYGLIHQSGKIIVACQYKDINFDEINGYFIVQDSNNKWGLMDNNARIIEPLQYDNLEALGKNLYIFTKDSIIAKPKLFIKELPTVTNTAINIDACKAKEDTSRFDIFVLKRQGIINLLTHQQINEYDKLNLIELYPNNIVLATKNDKMGILNDKGMLITSCIYDDISVRSCYTKNGNNDNLLYFSLLLNNKKGIANTAGKEIVPCLYDKIEDQFDYLFLYKKNKVYLANIYQGLLSTKAYQNIIEVSYISYYRQKVKTYFEVSQNNKKGLLNNIGKEIMACKYDKIIPQNIDFFCVEENKNQALFNKEGKQLSPFVYDKIEQLEDEKYFRIFQHEQYGIINDKNEIILPSIYDNISIDYGGKPRSMFFIIKENNQTHYFDLQGKEIPKPPTQEGFTYKENAGFGYTDKNGVEIIPYIYERTTYTNWQFDTNHCVILKTPQKENVINQKNELLMPLEYQFIEKIAHFIIYKKENKYGIVNKKGKIILPFEYDDTYIGNDFYNVSKNGKVGSINENGELIIPCIYQDISKESNFFIVQTGNLYGIVDKQHKILLPCMYENIRYIDNQVFMCEKKGEYDYFIPYQGIVFHSKEELNTYSFNNILYIEFNKKIFSYNKRGEKMGENIFARELIFNDIYYIGSLIDIKKMYSEEAKDESFKENIILNQTKCGIIDTNGTVIMPFIYDYIKDVHDGYLFAKKDEKLYKLDNTGNTLPLGDYEIHEKFSNSLIAASSKNKWGFLDMKGNIKIPFQYDLVSDFYKYMTVVYQQEKCGIINTNGKILVPIIYDGLEILDNTYIKAKKDCKFGIINNLGEIKVPIIYDFIESREYNDLPLSIPLEDQIINSYFKNSLYYDGVYESYIVEAKRYYDNILIMQNNLMGVTDMNGKILIPCQYETLKRLSNNCFEIKDSTGKVGLLDINHNILVPTIYYRIQDFWHNEFIFIDYNQKYFLYDTKTKKMIIENCNKITYNYDETWSIFKDNKEYRVDANNNIFEISCEE